MFILGVISHGLVPTSQLAGVQFVHPDVIFLVLVLEGGYLALLSRGARRDPVRYAASPGRVVTYTLGVLTIWVASGTPIHDWAEQYLFSVHMVEHLLLTMVAAPLLILGTPGWMLRPLLTRQRVYPFMRVLLSPLIAIALFNATTLVTHLPSVMDFTLEHHLVHFGVHVVLVATALIMWWPVLSPLPELPRLHFSAQFIYLFVQSLVPSIVASVMTYGTTVLYQFYAQAPRRWGLSPLDDQTIAGLIMKLSGGAIIFSLMAVVFFRWYNQEQREHPDALEALDADGPTSDLDWKDIQKELKQMGLTHR